MRDIFSYMVNWLRLSQVYVFSEIINCTKKWDSLYKKCFKYVCLCYMFKTNSPRLKYVTSTYPERPFCRICRHIQLIIYTKKISMAANNHIISRILLMIPSSGGKPDNELFDRSRTPRRSLQASTGNSFN